jgi:uncharacterized protein with GYD domain
MMMATFVMCGKYTAEAIKGISAERTKKIMGLVKKFGGDMKEMYALLGEKDLVFIVTLPGMEQALQVSVGLNKMTGIAFTTSPAVSVAAFDKLMTEV